MPNLGHTMEEGTVSEWLKQVGDTVARGEIIALVETDKATFEVESPADGVMLSIRVPAGEVASVGAEIALVGQSGENAATSLPAAAPAPGRQRARPKASPAARALAEQLGVDLAAVTGTGPDGIIERKDVSAHAAAHEAAPAAPPQDPQVAMRLAIAEATQKAWSDIPHVVLFRHADVTDIVVPRRLGLTAAFVRATAIALTDHRAFNGWFTDGRFTPSASIDIGIAVAVPAGLVMPVVRGADALSCAQIGTQIAGLADQARAGRLDGAKMIGASFSISSLGRFGVEAFAPIISAPQVAILGVGAIDRRAREAADGGIVFRSEVALSLVFDHRANDGAEAAALLKDICDLLARPERLELPA